MRTQTPFVIVSAQLPDLSEEVNRGRHDTLRRQLIARGFSPIAITAGSGHGEATVFLVPLNTQEQRDALQYVYQLVRRYGQPSIVSVDANHYTTVVSLAPGAGGIDVVSELGAGIFTDISPLEASLRDHYWLSPAGVAYSIAVLDRNKGRV